MTMPHSASADRLARHGDGELRLAHSSASPTDLVHALPVRNHLLASLSAPDLAPLWSSLERVQLEARDVLFAPETPIRYVYFPETAVASLVSELHEGGTIEVGTAGREGMVGLPVFLGEDRASVRAFIQIPGTALRMEADRFARLAGVPSLFHQMMLHYTLAFLTQVA